MNLVYDGYNLHQIEKEFGERPGGYRVDPNYIRHGIARKPYFWDAYRKKWVLISLGDTFFYDKDGTPRKTGKALNSGNKTW